MSFKFDKRSTQRIVSSVKKVERSPDNTARRSNKSYGNGGGANPRLVKLTEQNNGSYSWVGMTLNDQGNLIENPDLVGLHSDENDRAIELRTKSPYCVIGDIVYLTRGKGDFSCWVFDYNPGTRFATTTGEISAGDPTDPGWGYANIKYFDNETLTTKTTDEQYEINNYFQRKVRGGGTITISWDIRNGRWWVIGADCGMTSYA